MNKRPSLQFYPADWRKDPELQMCSMSTQGIWINLLCIMWEAKIEGEIAGKEEELIHLIGCTPDDFCVFSEEIKRHNFGNVTNCNGIVTIINRRMKKAFLEREGIKDRVRKHRQKDCNEDVTTHSSSSTSSTSNKEYMSIFDQARKLFKGTKRGLQTEYDNFTKKHKDWKDILPLLKPAVTQQIEWRAEDGRYWKNFKTWINNRCWEETKGVSQKRGNVDQKKCNYSGCSEIGVYFAKDDTGQDYWRCEKHKSGWTPSLPKELTDNTLKTVTGKDKRSLSDKQNEQKNKLGVR